MTSPIIPDHDPHVNCEASRALLAPSPLVPRTRLLAVLPGRPNVAGFSGGLMPHQCTIQARIPAQVGQAGALSALERGGLYQTWLFRCWDAVTLGGVIGWPDDVRS